MKNLNLMLLLRKYKKDKVYQSLNLLGLVLGLTSTMLIFLFINNIIKADRHHTNADRIYRVTTTFKKDGVEDKLAITPAPLAAAIREDLTSVSNTAKLILEYDVYVTHADQMIRVPEVFFVEPQLFEIFDFNVSQSTPAKDFHQPYRALISPELSRQLGIENPVGKTLQLNKKVDVVITGTMNETGAKTHLESDIWISFETYPQFGRYLPDNWMGLSSCYTYTLLSESNDVQSLNAGLRQLVTKNYSEYRAAEINFQAQPLTSMHYDGSYADTNFHFTIASEYLYLLGLLGLVILALAIFNFVNISTTQSLARAREVGVRKSLGASRTSIIRLYLGETGFQELLAVTLSVALLLSALPYFNALFHFELDASNLLQPSTIAFMLVLMIITALAAGSYPAWIVSGFQTVDSLKSKIYFKNPRVNLRKGLLVMQFIASFLLVMITMVIWWQMNYIRSFDPGFNTNAIVSVNMPDRSRAIEFRSRMQSLFDENVVSLSWTPPQTDQELQVELIVDQEESDRNFSVKVKGVDQYYLDLYQLQMVSGRWFTFQDQQENPAEGEPQSLARFIVNESLVRKLGFSSPESVLGEQYVITLGRLQGEVIGVIKDFNQSSLHEEIEPMLMCMLPRFYASANVLLPNLDPEYLGQIEQVWTEVFPEFIYEYEFVDDKIAKLYEDDQRISLGFGLFTGMALLIALIGLFGVSSYSIVRRTREMGIRKSLGASLGHLIYKLTSDYFILIIIAAVIGLPVSLIAVNKILNAYSYHFEFSFFMLLIPLAIIFLLSFITISYQAFKTGSVNPAKVLKSE